MQATADAILLLAGRVHPLGDRPPAEALLIGGGRVLAVGSEAECRAAAPRGYRVLQVGTRTVTPGLTDAHVHFTLWALGRRRVRLDDAPDVETGTARVAEYAGRSDDTWIRGGGWDRNRWGRLPTRQDLDRAVGARLVCLESHDTHAVWLSSAALQRCGIGAETSDPPGGRIVRDSDGEPTGVLLENAKALAAAHLPPVDPGAVSAALVDAQREAHRLGITGVHSVEVTGLADFTGLEREDRLRLRVLQHLPLAHLDAAVELGLSSGWRSPGVPGGESWIRIGGIKIFLDGALGSCTAWMREPYEGTEDDYGISTLPPDEFRAFLARMKAAGFAAAVHAIGDAAVELALNELSAVAPPAALPHRIEHLQLCPPELWGRAGSAGIVASMQPVHLRSDIPAADRHWGARARGAYAIRPLLRSGAVLAFGSDIPVEPLDPRQGMFAAVRRVDWAGEPRDGWYPEHAISAEEALRGYTEGPARAAGTHGVEGRLLPGYHADLVVWDRDPLTCPAEELLEMEPALVMVGGEIAFAAEEFGA